MKEAYEFLKNDANMKVDDTLVVAVSGGPDSMALLNLVASIRKQLPVQVVCAHVHHNMRPESDEEKLFVEDFCKKNDIIFEFMKIEHYGDDNFHNQARTIRYQFFEELIHKYQAQFLLTAHHGDDLIETILMRIVRGSTLHGYSGFSKVVKRDKYTLLRPLIEVTKEDILNYLKENDISYVQDNSNLKDVYTRNRYRKYVVPILKEEDKHVHQKFYKFSKTLLEYDSYINQIVMDKKKDIVINHHIDILKFKNEPYIIQKKLIQSLLEEFYQDDLMLVTDIHTENILRLILSDQPNAQISLPNQVFAKRNYNDVFLSKDIHEVQSNYQYELEDYIELPNGKKIEVITESLTDGNDICRLSYDDIQFPLFIRTRKDGDRISVKGMDGQKKINDIFIDKKIPLDERNMWPVVVDSNDSIVWLPGLKKTKFDRTKERKYDIILRYY